MNRKELVEEIKQNALFGHVAQKQPYTYVELRFHYNKQWFVGIGFSKVNWPDKYDFCFGRELACNRAVGDIVKQIKTYLNE